MKTSSFGFQPLRWREAFGGEAPPDYTQNEGISKQVVENTGRSKIPMGISRDVFEKKRYSSFQRSSYWE
jgi:hypothetical protein